MPESVSFTDHIAESADGTAVAYRQAGHGPALVVVHGLLRSAQDYGRLATRLAEHFSVAVMDRRGRGASGPQGPDYSLKTEAHDVAAVVQRTGASLLFGHSYGGAVALQAAAALPQLTALALFEPAVLVDRTIETALLDRLAAALADEDDAQALRTVFRLVEDGPLLVRVLLRIPFLARQIFASPAGRHLHDLLPTTPAELGQIQTTADTQLGKDLNVKTLLIRGSRGPQWADHTITTLFNTNASAETATLNRVGHSAPCDDEAPDRVADLLIHFFRDTAHR